MEATFPGTPITKVTAAIGNKGSKDETEVTMTMIDVVIQQMSRVMGCMEIGQYSVLLS